MVYESIRILGLRSLSSIKRKQWPHDFPLLLFIHFGDHLRVRLFRGRRAVADTFQTFGKMR